MKYSQSDRLSNYRAELTAGVQLGLGYAYYDTAYLAIRGTHPVRLTVARADELKVYFTLDGGHRRDLPWETVLTYLCFGPGPYLPQDNILSQRSPDAK